MAYSKPFGFDFPEITSGEVTALCEKEDSLELKGTVVISARDP